MTLSAIATWLIQHYILIPFGMERFLQYVAFILVIASLVQFVEMFLKKTSPALYQSLGIFLPLITTNCAILGLSLLSALNGYGLVTSTVFGFGAGVGFTMAISAMAGLRENMEFGDVPEPFKGVPITLITAAIMSMAFMGFSGLIAM
jgi:electron transport complex protein RnfA